MIRKSVFILSICLAILSSLFVAAIVVVYYKQQEITQKALAKINEQFEGKLTFEDSYISPFTHFPYISIDLKNIRFFASKEMDDRPIYAAEDFYLGFNIWDILQSNFAVKKITIREGHLDLVKDQNGDINLLLAKGMERQSGDSADFAFDLSGVNVASFVISYQDLSDGRELVFNLDKLSTDLTIQPDQILLSLSTDLLLDLKKDGTPTFFVDKQLALDLDLEYFKPTKTLKIAPSKAILEEAVLAVSGQVQVLENGLDTDIKFSGEKPDFNIFAAFLPKEVGETVKRYKNEGEVFFAGSVKGFAGEGQNPAVAVEFGAHDAYFLNTGIQKKVDELRFSGFFTNGKERNLKTSEIQLQQFHAKPEEGVFQGRLIIRNFEDPYIKLNLNADLDLAFLGAFFELEGLRGIQGQVVLNMDFDELVDLNLPSASFSSVESSLQSELFLKNLSFSIPDYHLPVQNAHAYAFMRNGAVVLDSLRFTLGASDFAFSGELNNFSSLLHAKEEAIRVMLQAKSRKINLAELSYADQESGSIKEEISDFEVKLALNSTGKELRKFDYLPKGEFFIEDFYAQLKNYPHRFYDFHAAILIGENQLAVKNFKGKIDESDFLFTGKVDNYQKWFEPVSVGKSTFHFNLKSQKLQLKDLLSYNGSTYLPEAYYKEVISDLKLDGKLELNYQKKFKGADIQLNKLYGKFQIHPLKLEGFQGRLKFEDSYLTMEKFGGRMGNSDFNVDMRYFMGSDDSIPVVSRKRNYFHLNAKKLDLDALMGFESLSKSKSHADSFNIFLLPFQEMDFSAQVGSLNYHAVWLEKVNAKLRTTKDRFLYVDTLSLRAAEGKIGLKGYFNGSNPEEIYFHSEVHADKMDLDKLLFKMENFGKDIMINENLKGLVSGKIQSKLLVYPDLTPIINRSEAQLDINVYQGSLINFAPMEAMSGFFADRNLRIVRFDTLSNVFELKNGVLHIPKMTINSSLGFIELSGRQSLDLNMDYFVRVPLSMVTQVGFRTLFGGRNRNEVDPDQEDDIVFRDTSRRIRFVNVNIKGNPDDYKISLGRDRN